MKISPCTRINQISSPYMPHLSIRLSVCDLDNGVYDQHGICGAVAVEEYASGVIKRHEKTQIKKENDRTRLTYAQVG